MKGVEVGGVAPSFDVDDYPTGGGAVPALDADVVVLREPPHHDVSRRISRRAVSHSCVKKMKC